MLLSLNPFRVLTVQLLRKIVAAFGKFLFFSDSISLINLAEVIDIGIYFMILILIDIGICLSFNCIGLSCGYFWISLTPR